MTTPFRRMRWYALLVYVKVINRVLFCFTGNDTNKWEKDEKSISLNDKHNLNYFENLVKTRFLQINPCHADNK